MTVNIAVLFNRLMRSLFCVSRRQALRACTTCIRFFVAHAGFAFQTGPQNAEVHDTSSQALGSVAPTKRKTKGVTKEHPVKPANYPKASGKAGPSHPSRSTVQRKSDRRFGQGSPSNAPPIPSTPPVAALGSMISSNLPTDLAKANANATGGPVLGGFEGLGDNGTEDRGYAVDAAPSDTIGWSEPQRAPAPEACI